MKIQFFDTEVCGIKKIQLTYVKGCPPLEGFVFQKDVDSFNATIYPSLRYAQSVQNDYNKSLLK